jgi:ankyrin repeat protein
LKLLVKAGADVTLKDVEGLTALQLALQSSHKNCVDFLQTQLVAESSDSEDSSSSSSDSESESESESDAKVKTNRAASEGFASGKSISHVS